MYKAHIGLLAISSALLLAWIIFILVLMLMPASYKRRFKWYRQKSGWHVLACGAVSMLFTFLLMVFTSGLIVGLISSPPSEWLKYEENCMASNA